ncbi:MAG: class I SAM-dependent methyltransferase, partial [Bacteroidota bacterium]
MENRQIKEKKFWEKFAKYYDAFIKKTVDKTYQTVIKNINLELHPNKKVLEIGTGTGIIAFSICNNVSTIIATDISPEMIKIATLKQKELDVNNIDFQIQDSYNLPFPDKLFDIVIASNLLHLLYEPNKPLNEAKRVLKDDGILIVPTFCVGENMKSKILTTIAGIFSGFKIINKWRISEFKTLLTSNGFAIDKAQRIDGRFPMAYIVLKKNKLGIPLAHLKKCLSLGDG